MDEHDFARLPKQVLGEKGKTIFYYPFDDAVSDEDSDVLVEYLKRLFLITKEDRSFVILSTLIVESYVDIILSQLIRNYRQKFQEGPFSRRLDLLEGLELIPEHLVRAARTINEIRNKFAHNLSYHTFEDLDKVSIDKIKTQWNILYDGDKKDKSIRVMFRQLVYFDMLGFWGYTENTAVLKEVIHSEAFMTMMVEISRKRMDEHRNRIKQRKEK